MSLGTNGESTVNITDGYEQRALLVSVDVKVILSADPERSVTAAGESVQLITGVAANTSVTFNSGEMEKMITFAATTTV